jgi:hypothetical protein
MATGRVPTTANSPLTAKGDLFGYSTAPARLAVGNNGESLVADSAATTGLRYSATPSASNPVLNSAFQVFQRGTSTAIAASTMTYVADRWNTNIPNTGITMSQQVTGDTTNLPSIQYCLRMQRLNGQTGTGLVQLAQSFESINSIPFAGKTVTVSYYARKGANYSQTSSQLGFSFYQGTGTDQNLLQSYTGATVAFSGLSTLTTTWQRFSYTGSVSASATEIALYFNWGPSGTAGAADYADVTGVQIDIGSVALPFRTYAGTIQGELAACQRYYQRKTSVGNATLFGMGQASSTTQAYYSIPIPVSFRVAPSVAHSSAAGWTSSTGGAGGTIAAFQMSADSVSLQISGGAGLVAGNASALVGTSGSAYLELSAEL